MNDVFKTTAYERRKGIVTNIKDYHDLMVTLENLSDYFDGLSSLIFDNGHVIHFLTSDGYFQLGTELIDSAVVTINSIKNCITYGSFSDAFSLVRKFRDDIFLYLYFIELNNGYYEQNAQWEATQIHIVNWMKYEVKNLRLRDILKLLRKNTELDSVIVNHDLEGMWKEVNRFLNSCVHSNGIGYTRMNFQESFDIYKNNIANVDGFLTYISTVFTVLFILIKPYLIMSGDYVNALELGITPTTGSQYWIAPFIQEFLDKYLNIINKDLKNFLQDSTYMVIN